MTNTATELNIDGLVGPTHHYAGLSIGNLASQSHQYQVSRPRQAALEGLAKMKRVMELGVPQAVLPPQARPDIEVLRRLGFEGDDAQILNRAKEHAPALLHAATSASSMWAANAATVSPSADTADGRVHITPANLISQFHRSLEPPVTAATLLAIFPESAGFAHHAPLPAAMRFADEGAANHLRLAPAHDAPGIEIFVFGYDPAMPASGRGMAGGANLPRTFVPRQSRCASRAIARLHQLDPNRTLFFQQHPAAIDAGVFHNDVIAVSDRNLLLCHELAFVDQPRQLAALRDRYRLVTGDELKIIEVADADVPLRTAVATYLFNSQLLTLPDGRRMLLCPSECAEDFHTRSWLDKLTASRTGIDAVDFINVRQSMNNGGGPACLRLRLVVTEAQLAAVHPGVMLNEDLYGRVTAWVNRHYRASLCMDDLADPALGRESATALAELRDILRLT